VSGGWWRCLAARTNPPMLSRNIARIWGLVYADAGLRWRLRECRGYRRAGRRRCVKFDNERSRGEARGLVQYTTLAWSTHGFPQRFLHIVQALGDAGSGVCVVYHDVEPYGGLRIVDRLRRRAQLSTMRGALRIADAGVFTVPLNVVSWLGRSPDIAHFIPIGANLPILCRRGKLCSAKRKDSARGDFWHHQRRDRKKGVSQDYCGPDCDRESLES
jgi:hypothetical protein